MTNDYPRVTFTIDEDDPTLVGLVCFMCVADPVPPLFDMNTTAFQLISAKAKHLKDFHSHKE